LISSKLGLLLTGPQLNVVFNPDRQIYAEMRVGFDLNALLYLGCEMLLRYVPNISKAQISSRFNFLNS
jgi:hypothetical protein